MISSNASGTAGVGEGSGGSLAPRSAGACPASWWGYCTGTSPFWGLLLAAATRCDGGRGGSDPPRVWPPPCLSRSVPPMSAPWRHAWLLPRRSPLPPPRGGSLPLRQLWAGRRCASLWLTQRLLPPRPTAGHSPEGVWPTPRG